MSHIDPCLLPVRLNPAQQEHWRSFLLRDSAGQKQLLEDLVRLTERKATSVSSRLSRLLSGHGEEIYSWLKPGSKFGNAMLKAREVSREQVVAELEALVRGELRLSSRLLQHLELCQQTTPDAAERNHAPSSDPLAAAVRHVTHPNDDEDSVVYAPIRWDHLLEWVDTLAHQQELSPQQHEIARDNLRGCAGPLPLAGGDANLILRLLEHVVSGKRDTDSRSIRRWAVRFWLPSDEARDAIVPVEERLVAWLLEAGAWNAPLTREALQRCLGLKDPRVDPDLVWRLASAARHEDVGRREALVRECLQDFHGPHLPRLVETQLVQESDDGYRLSTQAQAYASLVAPLHLRPEHASAVVAYPDGQRLLRDAVALLAPDDVNAWCEAAIATDQPQAQPWLANTVLQGLSVMDGPPTRQVREGIAAVWAATTWMVVHGFGWQGTSVFNHPCSQELMETSERMREWLPVLAHPPVEELRRQVPESIITLCDGWLREPSSHEEVEDALHAHCPFQVPWLFLDSNPARHWDKHREIALFRARHGDAAAQQNAALDSDASPEFLAWPGITDHQRSDLLETGFKGWMIDGDEGWRQATLACLAEHAHLLSDEALVAHGFVAALAMGQEFRMFDWAHLARRSPLPKTVRTEFLLSLAVTLNRSSVLREWCCPPQEIIDAAARQSKLDASNFPGLERLAGFRHQALMALGDVPLLRQGRWSVESAWIRHAHLARRALHSLFHESGPVDDRHWALLVQWLLDHNADEPVKSVSVESYEGKLFSHSTIGAQNLALITAPPQYRRLALQPRKQQLWDDRSPLSSVFAELVGAPNVAGRWQATDRAHHEEREHRLLLDGDEPTQRAWLRQPYRFSEARDDLELADAVWELLDDQQRVRLLNSLRHKEGLDDVWIERAEALPLECYVSICQRNGHVRRADRAISLAIAKEDSAMKRVHLYRLRRPVVYDERGQLDVLSVLEQGAPEGNVPDRLWMVLDDKPDWPRWPADNQERLRDVVANSLHDLGAWRAAEPGARMIDRVGELLGSRLANDEDLSLQYCRLCDEVVPPAFVKPPSSTADEAYVAWHADPRSTQPWWLPHLQPDRMALLTRALEDTSLTTEHLHHVFAASVRNAPDLWQRALERLCSALDVRGMQDLLRDAADARWQLPTQVRMALIERARIEQRPDLAPV